MSIICLGELIIDFIPEESGKPLREVTRFEKKAGGAPANVAIGLHFHRRPVLLWSKVGNDAFGRFLKAELDGLGLDSSGIAEDDRHRTKLAFVSIDRSRDRTFEFHNLNGAERYLRPEDIDSSRLKTARLFHFGGVALLGDVTAATTLQLLPQCRQNGCLVSFDPNIRLDLAGNPGKLRRRLIEALKFVNLLKVSRTEYEMIFGSQPVRELLAGSLQLLIITDGENGARLISRQTEATVPSATAQTTDTTGAGDAFTAAVLAYLDNSGLEDLSLLTEKQFHLMGDFAAYWAARITEYAGAVSAYRHLSPADFPVPEKDISDK